MDALEREKRMNKALYEAVAAVYFEDRTKYLETLRKIIGILEPKMAQKMKEDNHAAYIAALHQNQGN